MEDEIVRHRTILVRVSIEMGTSEFFKHMVKDVTVHLMTSHSVDRAAYQATMDTVYHAVEDAIKERIK